MNSNTEKNKNGTACEYQENLNILRQIDFFSGLPLEATKVFAYLCSRETFKAGDFLFQQGEEDGRSFYIISGSAQLVHEANGNEQVLRQYGEGEFVGRMALMSNLRRLFSLKAQSEMTCLTISHEKFSKALGQFPDVMPKMVRVIVENIYNWEKRFVSDRLAEGNDCLKEVGVSLV